MIKFPIAIAALVCSAFMWGQKPAEIGLISDNDLYTSAVNDQYYTNGVELFYRYLGKTSNEKIAKRITEFRIGHYIYNPQSVRVPEINLHDRPFAGYLFAEAGINKFFINQDVLKINFQAGVVGPAAGGEQFQKLIHKTFNYHTPQGWQYQITNTLALQGAIVYSKKILPGRYNEKVDFSIQGEANVGTIWLGASVGTMARISLRGLLLPIYESALYGAALNHDPEKRKEQREFFIYLNPSVQYQGYDATIQGSHFNDDSPVTWPLLPFRFNAEAGVKYRRNNWDLSYSFNYRGKELSNSVIQGYFYGSIAIGYLL